MSGRNIKLLLFLTVLTVSALPLVAALHLLDRSLQTSLNLGFNPQIAGVLADSSHNLLTLKTLDPERQPEYRRQFDSIEELRHVYASRDLVRQSILDSLRIYFALGLAVSVILALLVAGFLSQRIARAYTQTFDELLAQREKVRYLQEMSSWQELAKMLAHEIKNPLTPIEVLVSSLHTSHQLLGQAEFSQRLAQTQAMIGEELQHLQQTVNKFADFARLPKVQPMPMDLSAVLVSQLAPVGAMFPAARIAVAASGPLPVDIDATLFRQVLVNIVRNGVEANPDRTVHFQVQAIARHDRIEVTMLNDGVAVPDELVARLFDPYVSGKSGKDNMGLGLAIVRKVVIEHGGDIRYERRPTGPAFLITLPRRGS